MRTVQLLVFAIVQSLTFINPSTPQTKFRMKSRTSTIQHGETKKNMEKNPPIGCMQNVQENFQQGRGTNPNFHTHFHNLCWLIPLTLPSTKKRASSAKSTSAWESWMGSKAGTFQNSFFFWRSFGWTNSLGGCFQKNRTTSKMDAENNGKNHVNMDDLGVPLVFGPLDHLFFAHISLHLG